MYASIKSELLKLLTVRSTYAIVFISVVLIGIVNFYATGYKAVPEALASSNYLMTQTVNGIDGVMILGILVGVLLFANEYRHNTITYSLTNTKSRMRFLLAKIVAVSLFISLFVLVIGGLALISTLLGIKLQGSTLVPQSMDYFELIWRGLFYAWTSAMFGLVMAAIIRHQVGAIAALFLVPTTIEGLLGLLLKDKAEYLPFRSATDAFYYLAGGDTGSLSHVFVALAWVVGLWVLASIMFVRRDAN